MNPLVLIVSRKAAIGLGVLLIVACPAAGQSSIRGWGGPGFDTRAFERRCTQVEAAGQRTAYVRADGQVFVHGAGGFYYYMDWNVPPPPSGRSYHDVGLSYGCVGLLSDGSVVHWANQGSLYTPPAPPPGMWYTRMDGSGLMLERSDGTIVYWGPNTFGQGVFPPVPSGLTIVKFDCRGPGCSAFLLSDGTLLMWGNNANGQCNVPALPAGVRYVDFALGHTHTLALRSDGWIEAFGGTGWAPLLTVPPLPPGTTYTMCAAGQEHSVAARSDNVLVAWGSNNSGQCNVPVLPPGVRCLQLDAGQGHTVARLSDGTTRSWGSGSWFQIDLPVLPGSPINQRGRFVDLSIGPFWGVVVSSDGSADAFSRDVTLPVLPAGARYVRADGSHAHILLLRSDGQLVGFGANSFGEATPPPLPPGMTWVDFALASQFSVAVRSDGQAFSFGNVTASGVIPPPPSGVRYVDVDCSPGKAILLRSDGQVVLIGSHLSGVQPAPIPPAGLHYVSLAANDGNNLAIRSDGEAVIWGWLGLAPQFVPPPPLPFGVSYVEAAGGNLQFALRRSDGEVVMCGDVGGTSFGWLSVVPALEPGTSYLQVSASAENTAARVGPTRTYVSFAPGCAGSRPATRLIPRDTPFVGGTHEVRLFDLPANVALLAMGFQRTSPLTLGWIGMPGCAWHVSLDATIALVGQGNQAVWELPIPDVSSLVGLRFYNQALVLDPAAGNAFGAIVSNAAEGVIGYR
jgi:alpha-tubulin suppressor-like RCC1 family protein